MLRAAFFDLDETVLRIDSGLSWIKFLRRRGEITRSQLARALWWSGLYKLSLLDMELVAARVIADLAGDSEQEMWEKCRVWYEAYIAEQVAPAARRAIARHRERGELPVLLTSSTVYSAKHVSDALGLEHTLCTYLEVRDGRFSGKIEQLCFGRHKVTVAERFAAQLRIDLERSSFYSDSYNDLPMLRRVGTAVAVNPDSRLRAYARRCGWRIEAWR